MTYSLFEGTKKSHFPLVRRVKNNMKCENKSSKLIIEIKLRKLYASMKHTLCKCAFYRVSCDVMCDVYFYE